eukprot:1392154-Amorphochlora_amoeboformis.AAC.1
MHAHARALEVQNIYTHPNMTPTYIHIQVTPRSVKPDPHVELNLRNQTKNETKSNPSRKGCHDDNAPSGHQNAQNAQNAQDASQNAQNACQNATDGRQNTQNASERAEKIST